MIREPLTVPTPSCTKPLSKVTLLTQIPETSEEQDKLVGITHQQSPSSFFFLSTFPCAFNQAQYVQHKQSVT